MFSFSLISLKSTHKSYTVIINEIEDIVKFMSISLSKFFHYETDIVSEHVYELSGLDS